jgi:hypothetical protein
LDAGGHTSRHPRSGSLREALLRSDIEPRTVEAGAPTPVLIMGAERRPLHLPSLLAKIEAMEFQWGVSDGN